MTDFSSSSIEGSPPVGSLAIASLLALLSRLAAAPPP